MKEISGHMAQEMITTAKCARHIIIVTHIKPDGDALGSTTGLYHFLKAHNCNDITIILPSSYPSTLSFLTDNIPSEDIIIAETDITKAEKTILGGDLIFCLDFNAFQRTEYLSDVLTSSTANKILIDHHLNPDNDSFSQVFSEIEISSASELVFHILMKITNGDATMLPTATATALYTGMTTDTNNFNNSTFPSTLMMASKLIAAGVERDAIIEKVMHSHKESRLRLIGHLLKEKLITLPEGGACMVIDKETMKSYNIEEGDTEGIVNIPLDIAQIKLSILLKEDNEKVRVSLRSKKGVSANKLAVECFNGGGHENASGGRLLFQKDLKNILDAEEYTIRCMKEFLSSNQSENK